MLFTREAIKTNKQTNKLTIPVKKPIRKVTTHFMTSILVEDF
jgi:hypothetical protein